jgi:hypothetical protein
VPGLAGRLDYRMRVFPRRELLTWSSCRRFKLPLPSRENQYSGVALERLCKNLGALDA